VAFNLAFVAGVSILVTSILSIHGDNIVYSTETEGKAHDKKPAPKDNPTSKEGVSANSMPNNHATIVVAAPGVREEDLELKIVDRVLHVRGETIKGKQAYCVDRRILLPAGIDPDSATATHADGLITISFTHTLGRRVPIVKPGSCGSEAAVPIFPSTSAEAGHPRHAPETVTPPSPKRVAGERSGSSSKLAASASKSEDEWEPVLTASK